MDDRGSLLCKRNRETRLLHTGAANFNFQCRQPQITVFNGSYSFETRYLGASAGMCGFFMQRKWWNVQLPPQAIFPDGASMRDASTPVMCHEGTRTVPKHATKARPATEPATIRPIRTQIVPKTPIRQTLKGKRLKNISLPDGKKWCFIFPF